MKDNKENQNPETSDVAVTKNGAGELTERIFAGKLPDLSKAEPAPLELTGEYWTPEVEGETRRMYFNELKMETTTDQQSGQDIDLLVAYFVELAEDGTKHVVRNASKRLTGVIDSCRIARGTPLEITYLGKKKNKTNGYKADAWSIRPLIVK